MESAPYGRERQREKEGKNSEEELAGAITPLPEGMDMGYV